MTSPSEYKQGDKVRYTGDQSADWVGLEGVVEKGGRYPTVRVTNGNEHHRAGKAIYPKAVNLTLISDLPFSDGGAPEFVKQLDEAKEAVEHPAHYGGDDNPYEVIKVAEAWGLDKDAYLFNVLKYIARAGKKDGNTLKQDLKKGLFYLKRRIGTTEEA